MATNLPPVPYKTPMTDSQGMVNQIWHRFLVALKERAGGDTAPTNNDLLPNVAPGTSGNVLTSNGTDWVSRASASGPTGSVMEFAGSSAPSGWLFCDGSAVSRITYSALFGILNTTYGAGDGSSTFNLPDLRGRVVVGAGAGPGLTSRTLAATGGEETHLLTTGELPAHNHPGSTAADHTHPQNVSANPGTGGPGIRADYNADATGLSVYPQGIGTGGSGAIGVTVASQGGGTAHNTMPPFLVLNRIIKT